MTDRESDKEKASYKKVLERMHRYCAYRERCHKEVRYKLVACKIYGEELEQIMSHLIEHDFLNEERFTKSYAGGKIRLKRWSKSKVRYELMSRDISAYLIDQAMLEIDEKVYQANIIFLIEKKIISAVSINNTYAVRKKVSKYMTSKGYSYREYKSLLEQRVPLT